MPAHRDVAQVDLGGRVDEGCDLPDEPHRGVGDRLRDQVDDAAGEVLGGAADRAPGDVPGGADGAPGGVVDRRVRGVARLMEPGDARAGDDAGVGHRRGGEAARNRDDEGEGRDPRPPRGHFGAPGIRRSAPIKARLELVALRRSTPGVGPPVGLAALAHFQSPPLQASVWRDREKAACGSTGPPLRIETVQRSTTASPGA